VLITPVLVSTVLANPVLVNTVLITAGPRQALGDGWRRAGPGAAGLERRCVRKSRLCPDYTAAAGEAAMLST
jgi:hypothetical protein